MHVLCLGCHMMRPWRYLGCCWGSCLCLLPCCNSDPCWCPWLLLPLKATQISMVCTAAWPRWFPWSMWFPGATLWCVAWAETKAIAGKRSWLSLESCLGLWSYCSWDLCWCFRVEEEGEQKLIERVPAWDQQQTTREARREVGEGEQEHSSQKSWAYGGLFVLWRENIF